MNDDIHEPRFFRDVPLNALFRTGHADLLVWVKCSKDGGQHADNSNSRVRRFSPTQTVYMVKSGKLK